jgi:hypothetical protein
MDYSTTDYGVRTGISPPTSRPSTRSKTAEVQDPPLMTVEENGEFGGGTLSKAPSTSPPSSLRERPGSPDWHGSRPISGLSDGLEIMRQSRTLSLPSSLRPTPGRRGVNCSEPPSDAIDDTEKPDTALHSPTSSERWRPAASAGRHSECPVFEILDGAESRHPPDLEGGQDVREKASAGVESEALEAQPETPDPDLVTWMSPNDPENPQNWPYGKKWAATVVVSTFTLIAPIASSMVAPSLENIGKELNIPDPMERALVLSIFVLAFAVGPLV